MNQLPTHVDIREVAMRDGLQIEKPIPLSDKLKLLEAIVDVSKGGAPMSSPIARKVVQHFHLAGPAPSRAQDLSPREREVLDLLACGYTYKEIGDKLGIGTETVRTYVKNICEKMHVRSRLEAVARHRLS